MWARTRPCASRSAVRAPARRGRSRFRLPCLQALACVAPASDFLVFKLWRARGVRPVRLPAQTHVVARRVHILCCSSCSLSVCLFAVLPSALLLFLFAFVVFVCCLAFCSVAFFCSRSLCLFDVLPFARMLFLFAFVVCICCLQGCSSGRPR